MQKIMVNILDSHSEISAHVKFGLFIEFFLIVNDRNFFCYTLFFMRAQRILCYHLRIFILRFASIIYKYHTANLNIFFCGT